MIFGYRLRSIGTLAAPLLVGFACFAAPGVATTAQAQGTTAPQETNSGGTAFVTDPNEYLKQQLMVYIRPRLPEEQAFIDYVVLQVKLKVLPAKIVNSAMLYARVKQPYPYPYFKMAVLKLAERDQIKLVALPPSTTTPNALPR